MGLRVHWIQHVPFEGLGSIETWLDGRRATVSSSRMYERGAALPRARDVDFLIVMGGPMSVNDEAVHSWLREEKRLIAEAVDAGRAVLGVCLGAQLIASAMGAAVRRGAEAEIGWFPVESTALTAQRGLAGILPARAEVFHWHGETFDLPPGAVHLARSEACENQAFSIGDRVLGMQFHLETTPAAARALVENCPADLVPGRYIQKEGEILAPPRRFERINGLMAAALDALAPRAER